MKLVAVVALLLLAACPDKARNESIKAANAANRAAASKQWQSAIEHYERATKAFDQNHNAWYGLGGAYMAGKKDYKAAADAFGRAANLVPNQAMYQMWYGIALYEKARAQARQAQADRESKKPEEIEPDYTAVNFEKAIQHLQEAVKLNKDLWRPHYYLGRIYRDQGKDKEAAEAFFRALALGPIDDEPWVAAGDMLLRWDYTDQAIQVAEAGINVVPAELDKSELWFIAGRGYDDKLNHKKAIEAYTKALEAKRDNHKAKFQRGQSQFRAGNYDEAKRDLEEFSKSGGRSLEFEKQQASKMLMDIAMKSSGGAPAEKLSPEELVKRGKQG